MPPLSTAVPATPHFSNLASRTLSIHQPDLLYLACTQPAVVVVAINASRSKGDREFALWLQKPLRSLHLLFDSLLHNTLNNDAIATLVKPRTNCAKPYATMVRPHAITDHTTLFKRRGWAGRPDGRSNADPLVEIDSMTTTERRIVTACEVTSESCVF